MSSFDQLGGEFGVRAIIDEFVERICTDAMIGFLFSRVDRSRLKQLEYEHAARFLGADIPYTGRALSSAHKRHPILGGHFARRRTILQQTLQRHSVASDVIDAWLAHQDALRGEVTQDALTQCTDTRYTEPSPGLAAGAEGGRDTRGGTDGEERS
jgi:hemoglobin